MAVDHPMQAQLERYQQAIADALALAEASGASAAEVAVSRQCGLSVSCRNDAIETLEHNNDGALGITVYIGQQKGSASTSELTSEALADTVAAALHIARLTSADPCHGLAERRFLARQPADLDLFQPWAVSVDEAIELTQRCERTALAVDGRIVNSEGATFSSHDGLRAYGNSNGFVGGYLSSRHSLSCSVISEQDGAMERDYGFTVARDPRDLLSPERVGRDAGERTVRRLGSRTLATGKLPVLFAPEVAVGLFGHLAQAISGGSLYRQSSFLTDSLGKTIFPQFFSIEERPHIHRALGSAAFDNEGVATVDRMLVENGELLSYLLNSYAARRLKMEPTGHAGGIHNWYVSTTGESQRELLKRMGTGVLVTEVMGQGVNIVTGDYSRGAAGFYVENGEIQYPVSEITIAGNLRDIYRRIVAVGGDRDPRYTIHTGSVLVDGLTIAGS